MKINCNNQLGRNSSLPPRLYLLVWATIILFIHNVPTSSAWDNAEMEMYDLVEEVGANFYETLGISQDATDKEIRQAYRKLSIKLHPDKNPAEDAATKFRQLVGIYEVLKNKELRESYHKVLVEGLPNWRQPMFYFRRARKFALWQVAVIILSIVSVGQYLAGWASYFEKRLSMKEMVDAKLRKNQRTKRAQKEGPTAEELEAEFEKYLSKPSLWNIAPIQICRGIKYVIFTAPKDILNYREELRLQKEEEEREAAIEAEIAEKERLRAEEPKKPRKRKTFKVPEKTEDNDDDTQPIWNVDEPSVQTQQPVKKTIITGGLWTDDDIAELSKLCSKFPGGTPERWEKISEILSRPVPEVTFMAKKVLEKLSSKAAEEEEDTTPQAKIKVKTKGGKADNIAAVDNRTVENWSADEQKQLEYALQCYPKGSLERWEKIAHMVPARSKEECMQRFKYVADMVKKKKEAKPEVEVESLEQKVEDLPSAGPESSSVVPKVTVQESSSQQGSSSNNDSIPVPSAPPVIAEPPALTPVQVPTQTSSSKSNKKKKSKSSGAPPTQVPPSAVIITPVPAEIPVEKKKKVEEEKKVPVVAPSIEPEVVSAPATLVETEIDIVAVQLQSLVDESVIEATPNSSTSNTAFEHGKKPVRRSSSSKSSSTEGEALVVVVPRGSKESSIERKNSTSSNNSENDWCVIDEESGAVTVASLNTH